jgi:hypothetical protein
VAYGAHLKLYSAGQKFIQIQIQVSMYVYAYMNTHTQIYHKRHLLKASFQVSIVPVVWTVVLMVWALFI